MRAARETCTWTIVRPAGRKVVKHCSKANTELFMKLQDRGFPHIRLGFYSYDGLSICLVLVVIQSCCGSSWLLVCCYLVARMFCSYYSVLNIFQNMF